MRAETNCVVAETLVLALAADPLAPDPGELEPLEVEVPVSAEASWSLAAVRLCCAWSTASCAAVGSSVASSWPERTCSPTWTETPDRVPLVRKFAVTSTPGARFPVPLTVDWTTPRSAVSTCVEVRVLLVGGPTSSAPATSKATPTAARASRGQLPRRRALRGTRQPGWAGDVASAADCRGWM
ncbi:MAG: hypothetical protein QOF83_3032 [Solirubrobacteraceae bacterium]|jgi:hypothetical protein|nr:hypothetical protein [Solirubrobacteraceae bacterium]